MTHYKLTYFDLDGGRAEPARIALHAAGIEFEDDRIGHAEFGSRRHSFPFLCVPVLEIDGQPVTQSNAINAYVGKLAGLYPDDPMQALFCDEVMGTVEDASHHIGKTFGLKDDALKEARAQLVERRLVPYLRGLGRLLERGGGEYFADRRLTMADLKIAVSMRWLSSGVLDHIDRTLVANTAPPLVAHQERVTADERVSSYYAHRRALAE